MLIDCILTVSVKHKNDGESRYRSIDVDDAGHYQHGNHDLKYFLQIIQVHSDGTHGRVLESKEITIDKPSIWNISFCDMHYSYDTVKDMIYTTQTRREI